MKQEIITNLKVKENEIRIMRVNNEEYISLTDLARYANNENLHIPIYLWMRNKNVILYLGLWEKIHNENFKGHEFENFANESGKNSFYMSLQKWIKETNEKGRLKLYNAN